MNTSWKLNSSAVIALLVLSVLSSCMNRHDKHNQASDHAHHSETAYICPMKCEGEKTYDKPGQCPVCNMTLEPLENESLVQTISPNKQVLSRQATVNLQAGGNGKTLKAQGVIDIDQSRNQSVAARFDGRIEKLYVKFSGQFVKQGDKIMDIYSPAFRTIQEEHLFIIKSGSGNSLIEKSREKLRLLGITEIQISELENTGEIDLTVSVFSPTGGYVFFKTQSQSESTPEKSTPAMNSMSMQQNSSSDNVLTSSASQIREGMYVNEGQALFSVNDLQQVWALVSISGEQLSQIHENQSLEIVSESNPAKVMNGKVLLTEQIFEEAGQRFARVRILLPNPDNSLKINSLVTTQFSISDKNKLQVPASAVYKTGLNAYVWVKTDSTKTGTGIFQLRKIIAGATKNGMTLIISGLSPDEEIATEAGLMTDSETFLNAN